MTCQSCGGWGISLLVYEDDSRVYALCLCPIGEQWRAAQSVVNASGERGEAKQAPPMWHIWAHLHGVPLEQIKPLEDAVTPEELAARGFTELTASDSLGAIASAAKHRSGKR